MKNAGAATVQPDKQGTIDPTQMWFAWRSLSQDIELMPQYYDLGFQLLSRPEAVAQHADEQEADCYHAAIMFRFAADRESIGWSFRKRHPIVTHEVEQDRGPVLVTVEYRIDPNNREPFLAALENLGRERRRDGAYAWGVFEDTAIEGRMVETFLVESWLEHLRQHERVTNADRVLQDLVRRFHTQGAPTVTHLVAAEPNRTDLPSASANVRS